MNQDSIKRLLDFCLCTAGLVALSPLFFIIAALIIREDGRPVFYRSVRVGKNHRIFHMFKFRTMVKNAEKLGPPSVAEDDPRVLKVGKKLRTSKLDELPQLFNVLTGEMSLVGPRPDVPQWVALFTEEQKAILSVTPGITDWASLRNTDQGEALAGSPDPDKTYLEDIRPEKLRLQLEYVKNHSLFMDFTILIKTLKVMVEKIRGLV